MIILCSREKLIWESIPTHNHTISTQMPELHAGEGNYCWIFKPGGGADRNVPTMTLSSHFLTSRVQIRRTSLIWSVAQCTPNLRLCLFWTLCASGTRLQLVLTDRICQKHSGFSCLSKNQTPKSVLTSAVSIFLTKTWMLLKRYG